MSKQPTLVEKYPVINRFVNSRIQSEGFVQYFCRCVSLRRRVCLGRAICLSKVRFSSEKERLSRQDIAADNVQFLTPPDTA